MQRRQSSRQKLSTFVLQCDVHDLLRHDLKQFCDQIRQNLYKNLVTQGRGNAETEGPTEEGG